MERVDQLKEDLEKVILLNSKGQMSRSSMTKINKDVSSIKGCLPGYRYMDPDDKDHRNLNAFV